MFFLNDYECGEVVSDNDYFLGIAIFHRLFDECEISLKFIVNVLRNESAPVVKNLGVVVHAALDSHFVNGWDS